MAEDRSAEEAEMLEWAKAYAKDHGYVLNPEKKQLMTVIRGLARNRDRFGKAYCPCRIRSGDTEKDKVIECPCVYHEDEISGEGHCHCNLYFKP